MNGKVRVIRKSVAAHSLLLIKRAGFVNEGGCMIGGCCMQEHEGSCDMHRLKALKCLPRTNCVQIRINRSAHTLSPVHVETKRDLGTQMHESRIRFPSPNESNDQWGL
jgi:hypothetical protein